MNPNYFLVGRIRSPSESQQAGDIVIKTVVVDGEEKRKVFQRDSQSTPMRLIYRAIDRMVGNENISESIEAGHKDQPEQAMNRLKNLGVSLKNVRDQLTNQDSAIPKVFDNFSENLNSANDLPGPFRIAFKLSERFDAQTLVDELKSRDSGFSDATLAWLKDCHQNVGRSFSHAECARVGQLREEFAGKFADSPPANKANQRILRELHDLKLRMEKSKIGLASKEFKARFTNVYQNVASVFNQQGKKDLDVFLIEVLTKPDLPIQMEKRANLAMALGYIHARWDSFQTEFDSRRPDFVAEFKAFLQRIDQACKADPQLAKDLANSFLPKSTLDKLIRNCEALEAAKKKQRPQ